MRCNLLHTINCNRKSIFWRAATCQMLWITIENQYHGVLQLAKCSKLRWRMNLMVCCNSPSPLNYIRKSIFWCAATRQVCTVCGRAKVDRRVCTGKQKTGLVKPKKCSRIIWKINYGSPTFDLIIHSLMWVKKCTAKWPVRGVWRGGYDAEVWRKAMWRGRVPMAY